MPVRIRSLRDGFRRCGVAHSADFTSYDDGHWTPEQLDRLLAEPMLVVEFVDAQSPTPKRKRGTKIP